MSQETLQDLNLNTLIGMTDKRGKAWHYREQFQGEESNHYPGPVPIKDVRRRLFGFIPVDVPSAMLLPTGITRKADLPSGDHTFVKIDGEYHFLYVQQTKKGVVASDRVGSLETVTAFRDVDVFFQPTKKYQAHAYDEWLLGGPAGILGDELVISSAGLLRDRAVAWVEVSVPENRNVEGFVYRPNLLCATSLNGMLSTQYSRTITAVVCDNTMSAALAENGPRVKIRHSKYSMLRYDDAMAALDIVNTLAADFEHQTVALMNTKVTDDQWEKFLTIYFPETDKTANRGNSKALLDRKRNELTTMYFDDDRVKKWNGNAFGVVQAVNTWWSHVKDMKVAKTSTLTRADRNMFAAVKGEMDLVDNETFEKLQLALV